VPHDVDLFVPLDLAPWRPRTAGSTFDVVLRHPRADALDLLRRTRAAELLVVDGAPV
jgi:hypothetical protein